MNKLELLSVPEAANILGVHRVTIWDWLKAGKLIPFAYVGRKPVFDPSYIEEFRIERQHAEQTEPQAATTAA